MAIRMSGLFRVAISGPEAMIDAATFLLERKALAISTIKQPDGSWQLEGTLPEKPDAALLSTELAMLAVALNLSSIPLLEIEALPALDWQDFTYCGFPAIRAGRFYISGHRNNGSPPHLWPLTITAATAFGTGEHATTKGCLIMLNRLAKGRAKREKWRLADIGCGSGILAMGWARAAKTKVWASDLDPEAVRITRLNSATNGLTNFINVGGGAGYSTPIIRRHAPYRIVTANILARPLCRLAKDLRPNLAANGRAVLSGLLNTQESMVLAAHRQKRLYLEKRWRGDGWSVLVLRKKKVFG